MKSLKDRIGALEAKIGSSLHGVEIDGRTIDFRECDTLALAVAIFRRSHAQLEGKPIPTSRFDSMLDRLSRATSVAANGVPLLEATWQMLRKATPEKGA